MIKRHMKIAAQKIGHYHGRAVYRFPVTVYHNDSRRCATIAENTYTVIAHTAAEAANLIRAEVSTIPETEIVACGPRGGEVTRYVGWDSAIGESLMQLNRSQLNLF